MKSSVKDELDQEWVNLIMTARQMGFTKEDIKSFLKKEEQPEDRK